MILFNFRLIMKCLFFISPDTVVIFVLENEAIRLTKKAMVITKTFLKKYINKNISIYSYILFEYRCIYIY